MAVAHPISASKTVGVRELRQNLSKYLERIKQGETLAVTERGHEIARLVPSPKAVDSNSLKLAEKYGATLPTKNLLDVIDNLPPRRKRPAGTTDALLEESRRDSFD
jgi:prevent-host-death family protein